MNLDELKRNKDIFDDIFSEVEVEIVTKEYYNSPNKEYATYYVTINNKVDMIDKKIKAVAKNISGSLKGNIRITGFLTDDTFLPQDVYEKVNQVILNINVDSLFNNEEWPTMYRSMLIEAVRNNIRSVHLERNDGKSKTVSFSVKEIQMV